MILLMSVRLDNTWYDAEDLNMNGLKNRKKLMANKCGSNKVCKTGEHL